MNLLLEIRDETHRFTNTHHIRKRDIEDLSIKLREIPGIGNKKIIEREWDRCSEILGMGKTYPNQSFAPALRDELISVLNCSCITYPYEEGFSTFKEFFQQKKIKSRDEQVRLLELSIQGILEKLRMLQGTGPEKETITN